MLNNADQSNCWYFLLFIRQDHIFLLECDYVSYKIRKSFNSRQPILELTWKIIVVVSKYVEVKLTEYIT